MVRSVRTAANTGGANPDIPADPDQSGAPRRGRPPKSVPAGTDLRALLVDAAAAEIREVGFHATSSNRIAARAGVSAGVFYNYFADKTAALLEVYQRWMVDEWSVINSTVTMPHPTDRQLRSLVDALVDHHKDWVRLRHALVSLSHSDERVAHARSDSRCRQVEQVLALLGRRPSRRLRAQIVLRLLAFEAVADSIASGETDAMGIGEPDLAELLADLLRDIVRPA
jgi:AcrR family transcriptional regulator